MCGNRKGFTLVEILWVIMFLGLLVGIVVPKFADATDDAKMSNLMKNLQQVRSQLQIYKLEHRGSWPTNISAQLTSRTKQDGTVDPAGVFGPYLKFFPDNRYIDDPTKSDATSGAAGDGWTYDSTSGQFNANSTGHEDL
jgi:general secretion pathway protein G